MFKKRLTNSKKGISPIIGVILFVAISVILGAFVLTAGMGFSEQLSEPKPNVVEYGTNLETQEYYDSVNDSYFNGGIITFRYFQGSTINVENINILVDVSESCGKEERIVNLPADGNRLEDKNVRSGNISSSPVSGGIATDLGELKGGESNDFGPGSAIRFRIASSDCKLSEGDDVSVSVIHTPTRSVIMKQEFIVEQYTTN